MYEHYYGLAEKPFSLTPDTDFYYQSYTHQQALNVLMVAIKSGDGFIKVTGEVGTGKTLLCRKLLDALDDEFNTIYIPNPYLDSDALLKAIVAETGLTGQLNQDNPLACINDYLIESARQSKTTVLILDEAQSLPEQSLEAIRLLSNLETEKKKLVQIILFGQPELDQKLAKSSIRQLQQRIVHACHLQPLDKNSVRAYLQHRIQSAGYNGPEIFDRSARQLIFKISAGIPRVINVLSNKALLLCYASGDFYVSKKHIQAAAADSKSNIEIPLLSRRQQSHGFSLAMVAVLVTGVLLVSLY